MAEQAYTVASDSEASYGEQPSPFPDVALGIDIGTSQCGVAIWNGSSVELLTNARNEKRLRSYVLFKDTIPTGGVREELAHPEEEIFSGSAIFNIKRLIGRVDTDPAVQASKTLPFLVQTLGLGVRPFIAAQVNNVWRSTTPEEVLAIFLLELSRFQHTRVERACEMAGLRVLRLMPEPTAVALLYAQQQLRAPREKTALIFNMGAGYTDVAVATTAGGVSQIKALAGCTLGGEDVLQSAMRRLGRLAESASLSRLRVAAQRAVHALSSDHVAPVEADVGRGEKVDRTLARAELEDLCRPILERCEGLVRRCMEDARVSAMDVDDVILVGGGTRMPSMKALVLGLCGKEGAYEGLDEMEAAVRGAALEGAVASGGEGLDLLTIQATSLSLGVRGEAGGFVPVVRRNTAVPARKEARFTTVKEGQEEALVVVCEGEGKMARDNHLLGFFKVSEIPPGPKGSVEISVCMDIDASNVLRVFAGVVSAGASVFEVRMPLLDDGHGWCIDALDRLYGSTMDLCPLAKSHD
ncbi:heat-shock protein 70T-2 isoform X2 [Wolffia australiana]